MSLASDAPPSTGTAIAMDTGDEELNAGGSDVTLAVHDVITPPLHEDEEETEKNTRDGEEGEEEEEEELESEEYRCDVCNDTFHSLTHFMDHRNFECVPGKFHRSRPN